MSETARKYLQDQAAAIGAPRPTEVMGASARRYLTKKETADLFRVHESTIMRWVSLGILSAPLRPSGSVGPLLFAAEQLEADASRWKTLPDEVEETTRPPRERLTAT